MFKYCKNLIDFEFDISDDKIEECPICFEDKKLKLFCDKHRMCNKCCKACIEQNNLCPICREMCSNPKYMKYNVQFSNLNFDTISILNLEIFFKHWHKPYCIKKKHKKEIPNSWNNSAITPGTEFMKKLNEKIYNYSTDGHE